MLFLWSNSLISGSWTFSKSSLFIWKFSLYLLLKPSLKNFEHYLASMWNEPNFTVVWTFFGIAFFRTGMKTDLHYVLIVFSAQNISMSSVFNSIISEILSHLLSKANFEILLLLFLNIKLFWKECRSILRLQPTFKYEFTNISHFYLSFDTFLMIFFSTHTLNIVTQSMFYLYGILIFILAWNGFLCL